MSATSFKVLCHRRRHLRARENQMNTLISLQEAAALVAEGRPLMFADDEALLRQWTLGRWLWHRLVAVVERLGGAVIPWPTMKPCTSTTPRQTLNAPPRSRRLCRVASHPRLAGARADVRCGAFVRSASSSYRCADHPGARRAWSLVGIGGRRAKGRAQHLSLRRLRRLGRERHSLLGCECVEELEQAQ